MPTPLKRSQEGAALLKEADVASIIGSLGLGIAEAQTAMDANSVQQVLAMKDLKLVNGKSLLELGFTPAFYHFQYADVSASISLRMREYQSSDVDVSVTADFKYHGGYSKENLDYLKETENASYRKGYKSSREFLMSSSETSWIKVNEETVTMDQQQGAVSKVESFQDRLQSVQNVERARSEIKAKDQAVIDATATTAGVTVQNHAGYVTITLPQDTSDNEGILKVSNYNADAIDLNGATTGANFTLQADFAATLATARTTNTGGTVIGLNKTEINTGTATQAMPLIMNFDYNVDKVEPNYHNNAGVIGYIDMLVKVLKTDSSAKVQVSGYTDGSGDTNYNTDLSMRRAENMIKWLTGKGVPAGQFLTPQALGESEATTQGKEVSDRKVKIELTTDGDYYLFSGGVITTDATPNETATTDANVVNGFMHLKAGYGNTAPTYTVKFDIGSETFNMTVADLNAIMTHISSTQSITDNFSAELIHDRVYLLQNESLIKWSVLNKSTENIEMESKSTVEKDENVKHDSYLIDETSSSSTQIKKNAEQLNNPVNFAMGASVDVRSARQFELNVEGNASVSARLVSLPAPPEFLDEIKTFLN